MKKESSETFPNKEELTDAKEKLERWKKSIGTSVIPRIKRKEAQSHLSINKWKEETQFKEVSLSEGSIRGSFKFLNTIEASKSLKDTAYICNRSSIANFRDEIDRASNRLDAIEAFLEHKINDQNDFQGRSWFAYFMVFKDRGNSEPMLGRALLEIDDNHRVTFYNTNSDNSVDYFSSNKEEVGYKAFTHLSRGLICFDLYSKQEGRNLHLKVHCSDKEQEVLVGQFVTYENTRIESGAILLHSTSSITDEALDKNEEGDLKKLRGCYSLFSTEKQDFESIPEPIVDYFTLKMYNYQQSPKNISSIEKLSAFLDRYDRHAHKNTWFLEKNPPEIFVATPIMGNNNYNEPLINDIVKDLGKDLPKFNVTNNLEGTGINDKGELEPIKNLEALKSTRIFILLLEEIEKASYSLIQLGWALAYCKLVVVVYKEDAVSKRIVSFKDYVMIKIEIDAQSNIRDEWKNGKLRATLVEKIQQFTPKTLDGKLNDM